MRFIVQFAETRADFKAVFGEDNASFRAAFDSFQVATELVGGELYTGAYDVIPRVVSQTLETKHKVMTDDLTVCEIPYSEVSNISGGMTATIG